MVSGIPDGAVVLVDGLIASAAPDVLVPEARRLALVVLVHMPLGDGPPEPELATPDPRARPCCRPRAPSSRPARGPASGCSTSTGSRRTGSTSRSRVRTPPTLSPGTASGTELLCVAAVMPHKGHDMLLASLAIIADSALALRVRRPAGSGSGVRRPDCGAEPKRTASPTGSGSPARGHPRELDRAYAAADVLVLASYAETYGMVVTEALARGLPVIAAAVGGVPEALGRTAEGGVPACWCRPGTRTHSAPRCASWLNDAGAAATPPASRAGARERRSLGWSTTTDQVARVLSRLAAGSGDP